MPLALPRTDRHNASARISGNEASVLVACPDARPPAYKAVGGLAAQGMLDEFVTSFYHDGRRRLAAIGRRVAPNGSTRLERRLLRRHDPWIPSERVLSAPWVDVALAFENRLGRGGAYARHALARWRTTRFDALTARRVRRRRPSAVLVFSDVGSEHTLPACRALGCPTLLSMVHGDVREEIEVLNAEAERSPEFLPLYLADGPLDRRELDWLHGRRLRDLDLANHIVVPSRHIADRLAEHGTPPGTLDVVPYAADIHRFRPDPAKSHRADSCTFLFAGGITQRKGIRYLLDAWRLVRRPGWRLRLLGGLPAESRPLESYRDEVEWLGRVGHPDVPAVMASADVFVFPSLFEGSAVVTYEALACGLPSIVTSAAGSVVRDRIDGLIVPAAQVEPLAAAMERLGQDAELRAAMSRAARRRGEEYDWTRYQSTLVSIMTRLCSEIADDP